MYKFLYVCNIKRKIGIMEFPVTIESKHGEKLVFKRLVTEPDGRQWLDVENFVSPGAGPPMHVHFRQEESLTVVTGTIGYEVLGQQPKTAGIGETVTFKAGVAHRFWNAGDNTLHCTGYITPPDNIVYFLSEVYRAINIGGKQPDTYSIAFLLTRYKSEYDMLVIPTFVKKVIFPITLFFGRLSGKHKRFANAPVAVK
jgi:quercetin dioxygenase-like cupin family protein